MDYARHDHENGTHSDIRSAFQSPTFEKDVQIRVNETVGSASISPSGRDVVLASREGLHIIDLDSPYSPPRHLAHQSKWEVADVQWSPFASRDSWIVSTSNQKALVWNLDLYSSHAPIEHILHAHSRAITDINFSAHHPDMLATCAVDSFIHLWDLRHPSKPAMNFADWNAGATQVKWNRQDEHIVASSHDKFLKIWDDRKGAYPLKTIEAHSTKIYGIDWNRTRATGIVTCSLDRTVKFWDYALADDEPERVIQTSFPVWRARHTPFGWGVLAMPQRGNSNLHMYDRRLKEGVPRDGPVKPVHSFDGHSGQVKEFLWRSRGSIENGMDNRDFQLISWGTDRDLHLHRIDESQMRAVGHEKGKEVRKRLNLTRLGAVYKTFRDEKPKASQDDGDMPALRALRPQGLGALVSAAGMSKLPMSLGAADSGFMTTSYQTYGRRQAKKVTNPMKWIEGVKIGQRTSSNALHESKISISGATPENLTDEMTLVGKRYRKVDFERLDVHNRVATVTLNGPWGSGDKPVFLRINILFPKSYPIDSPPEINFERTTSVISEETLQRLSDEVTAITEHYCRRHRGSLEAVITYLLGERGLEESMTLGPHDPFTSPADESSSDDDDDPPVAQDDLERSAPELAAQTNVPMQRTCGAVWAKHGQLICFFPPKPEPTPIFTLDALRNPDRGRDPIKQFEGFGRLLNESIGPKDRESSSERSGEESGSSGSWSSSSSSSSSDESDDVSRLPSRFQPPLAWRSAMMRNSQKPSSHSSGGLPKKGLVKEPYVIRVHDFSDLLPARLELAMQYRIFGNGPEICDHNASVAADMGFHTTAAVWELCKQILYDEVPLEVMEQSRRRDPILVLAKRNVVRIKRKDSGLDLMFDEPDAVARPKLTGRVKWGRHPLASSWLVPKLFDHFERMADTQMLAMLSCIFSEPAAKENVSNTLISVDPEDLPIAMKAPAFSLDYFPSRYVAWSQFQEKKAIPRLQMPSIGITHSGSDYFSRVHTTYGSVGSSNGPWAGDLTVPSEPITPFSTGNTPPTLSRPHTTANSLSTSPDPGNRNARRSNSSLSTAFASLSRPFSITASSSPPANERLRNEADLSTSAPSTGITWGATTFYDDSSPSSPIQKRKSNTRSSSFVAFDQPYDTSDEEIEELSDDELPNGILTAANIKSAKVQVTLKNQHFFDEENFASVPILDISHAPQYAMYREVYANLLGLWELTMAQAELLKFNGLTSYWPEITKLAEQWDGAIKEEPFQLNPSRSSILSKASTVYPLSAVSTSNPASRKPSTTGNPSRPLNPTAIPFTPQPQLFQAQGGITRLTHASSSVDLQELLNSSQSVPPSSEKFDFQTKEVSIAPPSLLREATDRARQQQGEGEKKQENKSRKRSDTCTICWERVHGVHLSCTSGEHRAHMECVSQKMGIDPYLLDLQSRLVALSCDCEENAGQS